MTTKRRIVKRAAAYGPTPPVPALFGLQPGGNGEWEQPIVVGAALWVAVAMALAAFAIARLEHRSRGTFIP